MRSDRLGEHVKTKVVSQIAQIGADFGAAPSPQSIAFRRRRSVGVTAIHGSGFLSLFHAEVTRDGPFWSIGVPEIGESITTAERSEIADKAHELISSHTGLRDDDIRVVVCSERDSVRARARKLGFEISGDEGSREDLYLLRTRSVAVRYDDYGVVVNVDASR